MIPYRCLGRHPWSQVSAGRSRYQVCCLSREHVLFMSKATLVVQQNHNKEVNGNTFRMAKRYRSTMASSEDDDWDPGSRTMLLDRHATCFSCYHQLPEWLAKCHDHRMECHRSMDHPRIPFLCRNQSLIWGDERGGMPHGYVRIPCSRIALDNQNQE